MSETTGLVVPDFSEVKDAVNPGIYKTRVVETKFDKWEGKNGKPDTPYIQWTLETFSEEDEKNNGRKIFHRTPVAGKAAFLLKNFYKAAMGTDCPTDGFNPEEVLSRELEITVVDDTDKEGNLTGYTSVKAVKGI